MAQGTLAPAFLQVLYRSVYAPHIQTIPLKGWNPGVGMGDFDTWDLGTVPAEDFIDDYVAVFAPFLLPTSEVYAANIFTKEDADSPSILQATKAFSTVGSSADTGTAKAVQVTWIFSSLTGKLFKIVMLDTPNGNSFEPITLADLSGASLAFANFVTAANTAFSCRQDAQPAVFRQATVTLNAELQRQYHMN